MILFQRGRKFVKAEYQLEDEFEQEILNNQKLFFGHSTIYIESKKKIDTLSLGATIPDGFLFDMSDPNNWEFYLVEVELAGHDFFRHIFPQITKFFAFFNSSEKQKELIEKLFTIIDTDRNLKKQFKKYLGETEIYKFLNDIVDTSQNILMVIDGKKSELPEIVDTYADTWGKMVKVLVAQKYVNGKDIIYTLDPEFETIAYTYPVTISSEQPIGDITEDYHLEGSSDTVKAMYERLKNGVAGIDDSYFFNAQKYYVSIKGPKNIVFIKIRKKKLRLIIMLPEEIIKERIKKHNIYSLSPSVQNFYNGPCAAVDIDKMSNYKEVVDLIRYLIKLTNKNTELAL